MSIKVDVTTPEKLAFTDQVDYVVAPASDGEIAIMKGHLPLVTRLGVGEIRLVKGNETEFLAVSGGFLEVHEHDEVSVFAETADLSHDIDEEKARLEMERAKSELKKPSAGEEFDMEKAELALKRSITRLKIAGLRRKPVRPQQPPLG